MGGIKLTGEGKKFCEKTVLEAYYDPEKRKEIIKIAKVLEIDLEALKDSFLKKTLGITKPKRIKMLQVTKCRECIHCNSITRTDDQHDCYITPGRKVISNSNLDIIPDWCLLPDAPELE